jgi:dTMP kinase
MPYKVGMELKSKMGVEKDEVEKNIDYLKNSEESYLQLAKLYNWKKVDCIKNGELRTKEDISDEVYNIVRKII